MGSAIHQDDWLTIHHGDCLEVMATLPEASVDAIVTDPPYGLEFMGKEWDAPWEQDSHVGKRNEHGWSDMRLADGAERLTAPTYEKRSNVRCRLCGKWRVSSNRCQCPAPDFPNLTLANAREYGRWSEGWAAAALRVAKPGAYLLAFGGTRTVHRMTVALEDAGWIIRDMLVWAYACLSDDTEILTDEGWVRYNSASEGQHAAAFDPATGRIQWERIEHVHRYDHEGSMALIGPSLVTLNHRVVLEEDAATVPYLPDLWHDVHAARRMVAEGTGAGVLAGMQREAQTAGPEVPHRNPSGLDAGVSGLVPPLDERPQQSRLEGRRYRVQEARELLGSALRAGTGMGTPDVEAGRLRDGAPAGDGAGVRVPADQDRGREPREPRPDRQPTGEPDALAGQPDPQAVRVGEVPGGHSEQDWLRTWWQRSNESLRQDFSDDVALVDYRGVVWCITVPSGAFVARRNGVVFVTGNSGFPKSRALLKPAWEPIVMARKPGPLRELDIDGCRIPTDGRRLIANKPGGPAVTAYGDGLSGSYAAGETTEGRWPANVVLTDPILEPDVLGVVGASEGFSRFYALPKASRSDREPVMPGMLEERVVKIGGQEGHKINPMTGRPVVDPPRRNVHPTVKPIELMRHLVRLVTPAGGTVLDPFLGSGTTALAAEQEGRAWIGIEREAEYVAIAEARLAGWQRGLGLSA